MYMIATKTYNTTFACRASQTASVRYYFYSPSLRAPLINSESKQANQTQTRMFIGRQRDTRKDHIVNLSGFHRL